MVGCGFGGDESRETAYQASTGSGVLGPDPCRALNAVTEVGPVVLSPSVPPAATERQAYTFSLPIAANACVIAVAQGSVDSNDNMKVSVDNVLLGTAATCAKKSGRDCTTATESSLELRLPFQAAAGGHEASVAVKLDGMTATTVRVFAQGPAVTSFKPLTARPGDSVVLLGEGLKTVTRVFVNGIEFPISEVSDAGDSMIVSVPASSSTVGVFTLESPLATSTTEALFRLNAWTGDAPYTTPVFTPAADDSVAFEALIDAAGYGPQANSDWTGAAIGNVCQDGGRELVLLKNEHSFFSVLQGPVPVAVGTGDIASDPSMRWQTLAVGNLVELDSGEFKPAYDEIVAVRNVGTSTADDLFVLRATPGTCEVSTVFASLAVPGASDWVGAAVGDFDGDHINEIALLRQTAPSLVLVRVLQGQLQVVGTYTIPDGGTSRAWRGLAAGDLNGDGLHEVVAARQMSGSSSATVYVYSRSAAGFELTAASNIGNEDAGASEWRGVTVGDFNGDGKAAVALVRDRFPQFNLLGLNGTQLSVIADAELDSVSGQQWRALAAGDWNGSDQGADELIAVRAPSGLLYRTDLFIYGDDFHRASRDSGLRRVRGQQSFRRALTANLDFLPWCVDPANCVESDELKRLEAWLVDTRTNVYSWYLESPTDYQFLLKFLEDTKDLAIDGQQLRVLVELAPYEASADDPPAVGDLCSYPENRPETSFDELLFFPLGQRTFPLFCDEYESWAALIGALAQRYPHLVGIGIGDFTHQLQPVSNRERRLLLPEDIASIESRMRQSAPWMNFVPLVYFDAVAEFPDLGRTLDSAVYYFRNSKAGACPCSTRSPSTCLDRECAEQSIVHAPAELCDVKSWLARGRRPILGVWFTGTFGDGQPSADYDYELSRLVLTRPWLGVEGIMVYTMQRPIDPNDTSCTEPYAHLVDHYQDFANPADQGHFRYCTVKKLFASQPDPDAVSHIDLTMASCVAPVAAGPPDAWSYDERQTQSVVYRGFDGHVHSIWRDLAGATGMGHDDLSAIAGGPLAATEPHAFVTRFEGVQNVVYLGSDLNLHRLSWSTGTATHENLSAASGSAPPPTGGSPMGYAFESLGRQTVLYYANSSLNMHVATTWGTGPVSTINLAQTADAIGGVFGYAFEQIGKQSIVFRAADGNLHAITTGEDWTATPFFAEHDLTQRLVDLAGGAWKPDSPLTAYVAPAYNLQNVVFYGEDGNLHGVYCNGDWGTCTTLGAFGVDNLTSAFPLYPPTPHNAPAAYFDPSTASHRVVYRTGADGGELAELSWTTGDITFRPLSQLAKPTWNDAPRAVGGVSAYYVADGTHHIVYLGIDNHIHELTWGR
jgi:hypothetical protein